MNTDFPDLNEPDTGMALLSALLLESIAASFTRPGIERSRAFDRFRGTFNRVFGAHAQLPTSVTLRNLHSGLAQTDLDRVGQRGRQQVGKANKPSEETKKAWKLLVKAAPALDTLTNLDELIRTSSLRNSSAWELYFSTRPLGAVEVNLLDPKSQTSVRRLCNWLRVLRGNLSSSSSDASDPEPEITEIKWADAPAKPLIAITSYLTELNSWKSRVNGKSDLGVDRFNKLLKLVRETSQLRPRPHYVVFPELSIPREWLMEVASALQRSGISLIAGVEYEISLSLGRRVCHNSAFLVLRSTDLPAKDDWKRDLVRVQGGVNDYLVVGEVDFQSLRHFQSQHRSPTGRGVMFKPVPTGFVISASRNQNGTLDGED